MRLMRKVLFVVFIAALLLALSACRQEADTTGKTTESGDTDSDESDSEDATEDAETDDTETTDEDVDVNANEEAFVQTGKAREEVTVTLDGATPSTIVVEKGELVTLVVYSERVKPTQIYNEDLLVDESVERARTIELTIEANEEGVFYFSDKNTGDELFKFMVAGMSFGQSN